MDLTNLKNSKQKFLDCLVESGYSTSRIRLYRQSINWIVSHEDPAWTSYKDILNARLSKTKSDGVYITRVFNVIYRFDVHGLLPGSAMDYDLLINPHGGLTTLNAKYKTLIDKFKKSSHISLRENSVRSIYWSATSFLLFVQQKNRNDLMEVTEDDVLDFVLHGKNGRRFSATAIRHVKRFFADLGKEDEQCARLAAIFPQVKQKRKNQPVLTDEEVAKVRTVIEDESSGLSLFARAVTLIMLRLWLRRSDVAALRFENIDWERGRITMRTQKTGELFDSEVPTEVLNAIYRYIVEERPESNETEFIFLTPKAPFRHIKPSAVNNNVMRVFMAAGIRQGPGESRGTHLFRRYGASTALKKGVPRPLISQGLTHSSPNSITPYLRADFEHLKKCALSIEDFPVAEGVFHHD